MGLPKVKLRSDRRALWQMNMAAGSRDSMLDIPVPVIRCVPESDGSTRPTTSRPTIRGVSTIQVPSVLFAHFDLLYEKLIAPGCTPFGGHVDVSRTLQSRPGASLG